MKIKYFYESGYLGYNEQLDQDQYSYGDYEFELDQDDERDFIIHELKENQGFDEKTAIKICDDVIINYDLTEEFLKKCDKEEIAEYFKEIAREEYEDMI